MSDGDPNDIVLAEVVSGPPAVVKGPYGVPRRFGLGTIFVVTTAFAVLLASLRASGVSRVPVALIVSYVSLVGIGQLLLFRGAKPRAASCIAGSIAALILGLAAQAVEVNRNRDVWTFDPVSYVCLAVGGVFTGYLAGGGVAGVFLIMDLVEELLSKLRRQRTAAQNDAVGDEPEANASDLGTTGA